MAREAGDDRGAPAAGPAAPWQELLDRLVPGARLLDHRPLHGGVSATTTLVIGREPSGGPCLIVVRVERAADFKDPDRLGSADQARLLAALRDAGLPVPAPLGADPTATLLGAPWLATAFVEGDTGLPPDGPALLGRLLARLHALPPPADLPLPPRRDPAPELQVLAPDLAATCTPGPGPDPVLLHGDYWPGNVLWRRGAVCAILDWEDAALGDPHADLATARIELQVALGAAAVEGFTRAYATARPVEPRRLVAWEALAAAGALASMDAWGLPAEALEHRRRHTREFLERARRPR
ncbi:phosphotransferase [Myxococcota bacterium]|nr:phosphotransferase [Myxococcota bacterium]